VTATLAQPDVESTTSAVADGLNVLVVEDNPDAAESLAVYLEAAGHSVRVVYDGTAAIAAAVIDPPDVLLLDINLPGADGWEVTRRIRAVPKGNACFVVTLTGSDEIDDRRQSQRVGADLHLTKPVDVSALVALLDGYRLQ
jgi:CheY-like chemotaxis protein